MTTLAPLPVQSFRDSNGNPLAGGSLYTYTAGTSTPLATYTDSTGATPNANPIVLNSRGEANVWLATGFSYKFALYDSLAVLIWTVDNVTNGAAGGTPVALASTATTDIGSQTSQAVEISGTTAITSLGTNYNGPRFLRFTGALVLTQSAALNLPGGANITTAAGDTAIAYPNLAATGWNIVQYQAAIVSTNAFSGSLFGCIMSTTGASTTMSISAGKAQDSTGVQLMTLAAIAKTTSAWAVGTAAGGLDTGTIAVNSSYHFYPIRRPDTGVVDVLFSLSATAPTMPANYTQFRRIGSMKTNGSSQWPSFIQDNDYFRFLNSALDIGVANPGTAAVTATLSTPVGVSVEAFVNALVIDTANIGSGAYLSDLAATDEAPSNNAAPLFSVSQNAVANIPTSANMRVRTNTNAQIRYRLNTSYSTLVFRIATLGWYDTRGRNS